MIYLELFWVFLKVGVFTIGGHYAMLPLIREEVVVNRAWVDGEFFINFVGIAESTPGPFALNIATFVGFSQASVLGAVVATLGLVLPAFIIILIIAKLFTKFGDNEYVKRVFWGFRPVVVALVLSAVVMLFLQVVLPGVNLKIKTFAFDFSTADLWALLLVVVMLTVSRIKIKKQKIHPVFLILLAAGIGVLVKGVIM